MSGANGERCGKIITFYSYKGGTGRSMALANVAWILASNGKRVLMVDWDLEAPGLHRYVHPFLNDKNLVSSPGVINMAEEYRSAVIRETKGNSELRSLPPEWYSQQADILRYATEVNYQFAAGGVLHFIPAGTQDGTYSQLVNRFNWQQLFDNLGGYHFFEAIQRQMRAEYDYVLIDSRTGVSDTSGLCTVQLPDEVVVCFTLNTQSLEGASAVAASAMQQWQSSEGTQTVRVWPVPTRLELAEKEKLDLARERCRALFDPILTHIALNLREAYWSAIEVLYQPFYAYEEVLAPFGDQPGQSHSMLSAMERLSGYLTDDSVKALDPLPDKLRRETLAKFSQRPVSETSRILASYAAQYEEIRRTMPSSIERTRKLTELLDRVEPLARQVDARTLAPKLFAENGDGNRVMALALAGTTPSPELLGLAIECILRRRSAFEQYCGLALSSRLIDTLGELERKQLLDAIQSQIGRTISPSDRDSTRLKLAQDLLRRLSGHEPVIAAVEPQDEWSMFAPALPTLVDSEKWHVVLVYQAGDRQWVLSLYDLLRQLGYEVFLDLFLIPPWEDYQKALRSAVAESQTAIVIRSAGVGGPPVPPLLSDGVDEEIARRPSFRAIDIMLDRFVPIIAGINRTKIEFSAYPDGPNGGQLLRLLWALAGLSATGGAARFATRFDEAAQTAGGKVGAAIRNKNPERLMQLFEQGGLPWEISPALGCRAVQGLIQLGRNDEALRVLQKLGEQFPKAIRLKHLLALALTRRRASNDLAVAQEILGELYEQGTRDPGTLSAYGATWLDRYFESKDSSDLRQARDLFVEAFQWGPDEFLAGRSAAIASVLLDDFRNAEFYAQRVDSMVGWRPDGDYSMTAAAGDILLIQHRYSEAAMKYEAAIEMSRSETGAHAATWAQVCRLLQKLKPPPPDRDRIRAAFAHLPDCNESDAPKAQ